MNRLIKPSIVLLTMLTLLTSCASIYAKRSDVGSQVDIWIDNHQYDKALETIAAISPDHPDYVRLSNSVGPIERRRQHYIQTVLTKAATFEPAQDWVSAAQVIAHGLDPLPNAPELLSQAEFYELKRTSRLDMDEAAILIARAKYITHARPYQESKLYNAKNRFFAQQRFNAFLEDARMVSRELYVIGLRYWQEDKYTQAREALSLSVKTAPNELSSELLVKLLDYEKQQRTLARKQQQKQISEQLPELERSFYERLNFGDFVSAQKILNEMTAMNVGQTEELEQVLAQKRSERVAALVSSGNTLYNSGFLNEAITRWTQALQLDPGNTAISQQLERANKFIDNLERWKSDPAPADS